MELATSDNTSTPELERWNQPRVNRGRYLATVFGLAVMGMNDACVGALLPYVCKISRLPKKKKKKKDTHT